jgi:nicotinamide phosphoribosyltransferase
MPDGKSWTYFNEPTIVAPIVVRTLGEKFGYDVNKKGFKVLRNVRVIQGDGVNPDTIERILYELKRTGWSAENIAFGMGGALLQKVNRDTLGITQKLSAIKVDGYWRDV